MDAKSYLYAQFLYNLLQGLISSPTDPESDIRCALLSESYTPDKYYDDNWGELSAHEAAGTGYTSGGKSVDNISVTRENGITTLSAENLTWSGLTVNTRYAVIYDNTPAGDNDKKLILYIDFTELIEINSGTLHINWETGSLFSLLVS